MNHNRDMLHSFHVIVIGLELQNKEYFLAEVDHLNLAWMLAQTNLHRDKYLDYVVLFSDLLVHIVFSCILDFDRMLYLNELEIYSNICF